MRLVGFAEPMPREPFMAIVQASMAIARKAMTGYMPQHGG